MPEDFCKKSEESSIQKRFYCNVCTCLIESVSALREHAAGGKHARNRTQFDPFQKKDGGKVSVYYICLGRNKVTYLKMLPSSKYPYLLRFR